MKGIGDRLYCQDRPTAVDTRINSYVVISLPSVIANNEMDPSGAYNDYSTTVLIEVYVRDKMSSKNPICIDLNAMDEKVSMVMRLLPYESKGVQVTRPEVVMQSNDGSGFHVTLIRAMLRTK